MNPYLKLIKALLPILFSYTLTPVVAQNTDTVPGAANKSSYEPYLFRNETIKLLSETDDYGDFEVQPLDVLIAAALKNSPLLHRKDLSIESLFLEKKMQQKAFFNFLSVGGSFIVTSGAFLTATQTPLEDINQLTQQNTVIYNVGLTLRIPLGDLVNARSKARLTDYQIQIAQTERIELEIAIKQAIIQSFHRLMKSVENLKLKAESLEFQELSTQVSKQYFREGNMDVSGYSGAAAQQIKAREQFINARIEAIESYLLLRELVGTDIKKRR